MDDDELIAATARGDADAFATLYRRHLPRVVAYLLHATGDPEVAADLAAEVFAAALAASVRYRPQRASAAPWLIGIAQNKLRESRRRGRVENATRGRLQMAALPLEDDDLERVAQLAALGDAGVMTAVDGLPANERDAVRARVIDAVLAGDGIAAVMFGESRIAAASALTSLLGPPSQGYTRALGECGVDHTMTWPDWAYVSANGARPRQDPTLTAYFFQSRFVGYQYGEAGTKAAPHAPAKGTVLATTRGLNVGDTLARGRQLYGSAFGVSAAQGGSWNAGRLRGYAWLAPQAASAVSPENLVATISAGDVGCPALTP